MKLKFFFFLTFSFLVLYSCTSKDAPERPVIERQERRPLITQDDNGKYTEWYPGHKQIKMTGRMTEDGKRTGIWKYYSELGVELSITVYTDGEKDGHIIVRYPNGALNYTGEYYMGKEVGEWKFYNEEGELTQTKNYDE